MAHREEVDPDREGFAEASRDDAQSLTPVTDSDLREDDPDDEDLVDEEIEEFLQNAGADPATALEQDLDSGSLRGE